MSIYIYTYIHTYIYIYRHFWYIIIKTICCLSMMLFGLRLMNAGISSSHAYMSFKETAGSTCCILTTILFLESEHTLPISIIIFTCTSVSAYDIIQITLNGNSSLY